MKKGEKGGKGGSKEGKGGKGGSKEGKQIKECFFFYSTFFLLNIPTEGWEGETKNIYFGGKVYINQHTWADRDKCYIYIINKAW